MSRHALHWIRSVSLSAVLLACGGDDDKHAHVSTGLPSSQKLSEIKQEDAAMVCDAFRQGVDMAFAKEDLQRISCTATALGQSVTVILTSAGAPQEVTFDVNKCEELVAKCERGESIGEADESFDFSGEWDKVECNESNTQATLAKCDATVGEFEACLNTTIDTFRSFVASFNCAAFKDPEAAQQKFAAMPVPDESEACQPLVSKCDGFLGELRDGSASTP